jgi:threonine/homoserine/homoserine lactone efflux protein
MAYILYLAYKIVQSSVARTGEVEPLGFVQGIVLNLINPKAYIVALAVFSQFAVPGPMYYQHIVQIMVIILMVAIVLDLGWIYIGALLKRPFSSGLAARRLNVTLAILLVGSVFIATFMT